jgi:hypothetical protein
VPARPAPALSTLAPAGWDKHSRPEALYFWFYFVIINAIWLVVPGMCMVWAARRVNAAVAR